MAHYCPDCGMICRCGGDLDDIVFFDFDLDEICTHCDFEESDALDEWDDDVEDEDDR
jgi:hypothetical protein